MMTPEDELNTIAYLSNELRKAHAAASGGLSTIDRLRTQVAQLQATLAERDVQLADRDARVARAMEERERRVMEQQSQF